MTFRAPTETATNIKTRLQAEGINTSVVRTPSSRLDMETRGIPEVVRASVHYCNTVEELDTTVAVLGTAR